MLAELKAEAGRAVLLVARNGDNKLTGIAALGRHGLLRDPLPILRSWAPAMMYSGSPLLDRRDPVATLRSIIGAARRHHGARALLFHRVEAASPLHEAFVATAERHRLPMVGLDRRECAALDATVDYDTWFEASFPRKRRKELRRLRARLSEMGRLESASWSEEKPIDNWIEQFIELERSGWKGKRGTAIGCDEDTPRFLSTTLRHLAQRGDLLFWRLALDDRPVAMLFGMAGHGRGSLIKIAYDEAFARYSPGVLIALDATADLMRRPDIEFVDSCAVPNHPMIDHLWRERMAFEDILIATPGTSPATFAAIAAAERARRKARETLKQLYRRYQSWKGVP
ncbi:MAG: GNAT family N-acetyltransferase [Parvibaculaceae bacterium]